MISGADRPALVLRPDQSEAESIAFLAMLFGIVLQVAPEMVGQHILLIVVLEQNVSKDRLPSLRHGRELKLHIFAEDLAIETDDQDAFPVLWDPVGSINDVEEDMIAKVLEGRLKNAPGIALVERPEVLDDLKEKYRRPFDRDDVGDLEEQVALLFIIKAVGFTKALLFGDAGKRKGLARKAGRKNVMIRDGPVNICIGLKQIDVPPDVFLRLVVPRAVGLPGVFVPFGGEGATPSEPGQGAPESANPGEQVNEGERQGRGLKAYDRAIGRKQPRTFILFVYNLKSLAQEILLRQARPLDLFCDPVVDVCRDVANKNIGHGVSSG